MMKKTIAAAALLAVTAQANAMMLPPGKPVKRTTVCLNTYQNKADGSLVAGTCDDSGNNESQERTLLKNGCAEGQVAITFIGEAPIHSCMPVGAVQL